MGVRVLDIVRLARETDVAALEPVLADGADLGARHLIAAPSDSDLGGLADPLGALAELSYR